MIAEDVEFEEGFDNHNDMGDEAECDHDLTEEDIRQLLNTPN